jgi:hypothetical protein
MDMVTEVSKGRIKCLGANVYVANYMVIDRGVYIGCVVGIVKPFYPV